MTAGTPGRPGGGDPGAAAPPSPTQRPRNPVTWLLLAVVRGYQLVVSPWMAPSCKYYPSCSAYAVTALRRHGALRGSALAGWRLLRCNPWSLGGVDHVPQRGGPHPHGGPSPMQETGEEARTLGQTSGGVPRSASPTRGARVVAPQDL